MRNLLNNRPRSVQTAKGERVYAVGDVHGRYDLLVDLLKKIIVHWESSEQSFRAVKLIFLGDIIDRGPDSKRCLGLIESLVRTSGAVLLLGNHEDLMLRSMDGDGMAQQIWLQNGGKNTLRSFSVNVPTHEEDSFDFGDRLTAAVPENLQDLLRSAPTSLTSGDYFYVHAGVRPDVSLARQSTYDLTFIREDFTQTQQWHGAMIVHGHSIVEKVEFLPNRIAVDTGAYRSGRLSCVCLDGRRRQVIST